MKPVAILGVALIVLGLAALAYQGITYTERGAAEVERVATAVKSERGAN